MTILLEQEEATDKLTRHMTLFDLLAIGVGGTVGSGVFVLAGSIAYATEYPAGPSVVLSFLAAVSTTTVYNMYISMKHTPHEQSLIHPLMCI